jgi:hypothetical protein
MNLPKTFRTATSIARHMGSYINKELESYGADPWRNDDDEICWDWISPDGKFWAELRILDSEQTDGSNEGFNFGFSSCNDETDEVGPSACPYNFTNDLWTKDARELSARLEMVLGFVSEFQTDKS